MDIEEAIANISKDTAEIIEVDELKEILKREDKTAYVGLSHQVRYTLVMH